jgi:hypothetical protein
MNYAPYKYSSILELFTISNESTPRMLVHSNINNDTHKYIKKVSSINENFFKF